MKSSSSQCSQNTIIISMCPQPPIMMSCYPCCPQYTPCEYPTNAIYQNPIQTYTHESPQFPNACNCLQTYCCHNIGTSVDLKKCDQAVQCKISCNNDASHHEKLTRVEIKSHEIITPFKPIVSDEDLAYFGYKRYDSKRYKKKKAKLSWSNKPLHIERIKSRTPRCWCCFCANTSQCCNPCPTAVWSPAWDCYCTDCTVTGCVGCVTGC